MSGTRCTLLAVLLATQAAAQTSIPPQLANVAPYRERDEIESSFVNLSSFPVRPMVFDAAGDLWALNHHDSTLVRFTGGGYPATNFPLPWNPVSIAFWSAGPGAADDELVITCRGTWAVVEVSAATGDILHVHQLRGTFADPSRQGRLGEPGDIVIVGDQALVSCSSLDTIAQIDLTLDTIYLYDRNGTPPYPQLEAKMPLFLSKDAAGAVYVAPLLSGNNTVTIGAFASATNVFKPQPGFAGLPDLDLFRIDPVTKVLTPVARGMGAILFAHGINPNTGRMWMLNTDAFNADFQTEPEINGIFASNRISIFDLPAAGGTPTDGPAVALGLDPGAPSGGVPGLASAVGQPFSLEFLNSPANAQHGFGFVAGLLTDNVTVFNSAGGVHKQWSVPDGSIPRQVLLNPSGTRLYVYCWGSNSVRTYDWNAAGAPQTAFLRLGHDPTPADLVAGRTLFFDAKHSRHGNLTCTTCHVEGGTDLLVWNLSNRPVDNKGPMVTQTLVGIERMAPFHWRGERDLSDFRGAFKGLLGKVDPLTQLPADLDVAAFAEVERYIFSLRNPANPNQSRLRQLDNAIQLAKAPTGNAVVGQNVFNDVATFQGNSHTCANCHGIPMGTSHDITPVFVTANRPRRAQEKAAAFHELWRKQMSSGTYDFGFTSGPVTTAFLGTGFAHIGTVPGLFEFINPITTGNGADITNLVHQWDQGLGHAAHYAYRLAGAATSQDAAELSGYLLAQARGRVGETSVTATGPRHCDIAVFGSVRDAGGTLARRRWAFDRYAYAGQGIFRCDDPSFTTTGQPAGERRMDDFLALATLEDNVFVGVPVGMGRRFGIDYDMDGTVNAIDPLPYDPTLPLPGGTGPSFVSSNPAQLHDLLWTSTKSARIRFDTDQPTRFDIWVWPVGSTQPATPAIVSSVFSTQHAALISGLAPSTKTAASGGEYPVRTLTYNVVVRATNQAQLTASTALTVTTEHFLEPKVFSPATSSRQRRIELTHRIGTLGITPISVPSNNPARRVNVQTLLVRGSRFINGTLTAPRAANRVIIGRVFLKNAQTGVVSLAQVAPLNGTCFPVDEVYLNAVGTPQLTVGGVPGGGNVPFLVTETPTLPNNGSNPIPQVGTTTLEFEVLTPMGPNDKVLFCVDSVLHVEPLFNNWLGGAGVSVTPTGTRQLAVPCLISSPDTFPNAAWGQWSFPDTQEANSEVEDP